MKKLITLILALTLMTATLFTFSACQPAEKFTGFEGKYVPIAETIRGFKEILEGKHDDIPEGHFLNAGTIDDVVARVK